MASEDPNSPDVSVVIPCLNEARTLAEVVREAFDGIRKAGLRGEVVVSDNGSTDGSQGIAEREGARVVACRLRGYGAALHVGIRSAKGRWVLFGDADLSYDFRQLPLFADFIRERDEGGGRDLVLGSRLEGTIEPGAMPLLNRYLGTPVLNAMIRLFFGLKTSDCNSGMRLVRRSFYERLAMRAPGMEWASELLIKAHLLGARYAEVPIVLRPDRRGRPPHMRRWRDGWRHLKTIVLLSPNRLILIPSVAVLALAPWALLAGRPAYGVWASAVGCSGLALGMLVKLVLHADGVLASRSVSYLVARPFPEVLLGCGGLALAGGSLTLVSGAAPSAVSVIVSLLGALMMLTSFAWGVLVTHCLHTLDSQL